MYMNTKMEGHVMTATYNKDWTIINYAPCEQSSSGKYELFYDKWNNMFTRNPESMMNEKGEWVKNPLYDAPDSELVDDYWQRYLGLI